LINFDNQLWLSWGSSYHGQQQRTLLPASGTPKYARGHGSSSSSRGIRQFLAERNTLLIHGPSPSGEFVLIFNFAS
jgi:hypothetical protein